MAIKIGWRELRSAWLFILNSTHTYDFYCKLRFEIDFLKRVGYLKKPKENVSKNAVSKLLVVVPSKYRNGWECGEGNFFYEICQSAQEKFPNMDINIFQVTHHEEDWKTRLKKIVETERPDLIFIYAEVDPDDSGNWTWPEFFLSIGDQWSGKCLFLLFDSAYPIHRWRASKLARITGNAIIASIDRKPKRSLRKYVRHVGPIFLPISIKSIKFLKKRIESKVREEKLEPIGVSFIGKVYPYRKEVFDELQSRGVTVELNPHRKYLEPNSYLSYLTALHLSSFTINLSLAGGVKLKQLKCRVLETAIFGNTLITDERKLGSKFFKRDLDFVYVKQMNRLSMDIFQKKSGISNLDGRESALSYAEFNFLD
jgi:hypothetical protein